MTIEVLTCLILLFLNMVAGSKRINYVEPPLFNVIFHFQCWNVVLIHNLKHALFVEKVECITSIRCRGNCKWAKNVSFTTSEKRKYRIDKFLARAKFKEI